LSSPGKGVEKVGADAPDTSKRAYFGNQNSGYPFEPETGMHYLLARELPDSYGLGSVFDDLENKGYTVKQKANTRDTARWYQIPEEAWQAEQQRERAVGRMSRDIAKNMAKTGSSSSGYETWVQEDKLVRGAPHLVNSPVKFNS